MSNDSWQSMSSKADPACPIATRDISVNLRNRQKAISGAGYGPLNPKKPNNEFWQAKAEQWNVDAKEARGQTCGNCAAFIKTDRILDCIDKGLGNESGNSAWDVIDAGDLGYCEAFDFKCAASRTCDAWIVGGPITEEKENNMEEKSLDEMFNELLEIEEKVAPIVPVLPNPQRNVPSLEKRRGPRPQRPGFGPVGHMRFGSGKASDEDMYEEDDSDMMYDDVYEGENDDDKRIGSGPDTDEERNNAGLRAAGNYFGGRANPMGSADTVEARGRNRIRQFGAVAIGSAGPRIPGPIGDNRNKPAQSPRPRPRGGSNLPKPYYQGQVPNVGRPTGTQQQGFFKPARSRNRAEAGQGARLTPAYTGSPGGNAPRRNTPNSGKYYVQPALGKLFKTDEDQYYGPDQYEKRIGGNPGSPRDAADRQRGRQFLNWAGGRNQQGGTSYDTSVGPIDIGESGARNLSQRRMDDLKRMRSWTNPKPRTPYNPPRQVRDSQPRAPRPPYSGPRPGTRVLPRPAPNPPIPRPQNRNKPRDWGSDNAAQQISGGIPIKSAWDQEAYFDYGYIDVKSGVPYSSTRRNSFRYGPWKPTGNPGAGLMERRAIENISDAMPYRRGKGSDAEMYMDDEDEVAIPPDMDGGKGAKPLTESQAAGLREAGKYFGDPQKGQERIQKFRTDLAGAAAFVAQPSQTRRPATPKPAAPRPSVTKRPAGISGSADSMERRINNRPRPTAPLSNSSNRNRPSGSPGGNAPRPPARPPVQNQNSGGGSRSVVEKFTYVPQKLWDTFRPR